jgi:4-carboxymuconolactone decarboxylase
MPEAAPLAAAQHALITVSAALATREEEVIRAALLRALDAAPGAAVDEVILQSHLFVGFPDALNALSMWRELSGSAPAEDRPEDPATWEERGPAVCAQVYGSNYAKLRDNVATLHPDLDRWMVVGGYGRVIGRSGLDLLTRELCIVALLAVWNVPRQLHSHLRGALNVGASVDQVDQVVEIACGMLNPTFAAGVRSLWRDVRNRPTR